MKIASLIVSATIAACVVGCVADSADPGGEEPVFGLTSRDPALSITRGSDRVSGVLQEDGMDVRFSSIEGANGAVEVRLELNGMVLTDHSTEDEELIDGVNADDGAPAVLTEMDRAAVRRLLAGLEAELFPPIEHVTTKQEYDALRRLSPAEERLFRAVDSHWSQWPSTLPLKMSLGGDAPRSWTSWRRYASTNTTVTACHDCNVCSWSGDCCDTGKKLGESWNGTNYGNCGTSSTGSQFTKDCSNHDQCVRTAKHGGHVITSLYCDDQFTSCVDDNTFAPSCTYDWRGTTNKGNCPLSWNGTGDGCDCFCQFQDTDC
jgi:hypothetical protein